MISSGGGDPVAARRVAQDGCMSRQRVLWSSDGVVDCGAVTLREGIVTIVHAFVGIRLAYCARETKVGNSTDTHFIHEDVFELDVSVDIPSDLVQVTYTPDDLAKHHASIIVS